MVAKYSADLTVDPFGKPKNSCQATWDAPKVREGHVSQLPNFKSEAKTPI